MPCFGEGHGPNYFARRKRAEERITAELVGKGLIPGHGKWSTVMHRKLTNAKYWK